VSVVVPLWPFAQAGALPMAQVVCEHGFPIRPKP
jgi:hypothetical protein